MDGQTSDRGAPIGGRGKLKLPQQPRRAATVQLLQTEHLDRGNTQLIFLEELREK